VALSLLGCAGQGPGPQLMERPASTPTSLEAELLADAEDRRLDRHTTLDAALIVSGVRDHAELAEFRARFAKATAPALAAARREATPAGRARALLEALFRASGSRPLFDRYTVDATTLIDVLERGRFNCVSSSIAYLIAAAELDLDVRPVMLPSHARIALVDAGRRIPVETTSPYGLDPDPKIVAAATRRFRAELRPGSVDLYADAQGTEVDFLALLGVVYTNLSTVQALAGRTQSATALAERGEAFVVPSALPLLRGVRAALLSETGVAHAKAGRFDPAIAALLEAARIAPDDEMRALTTQNLVFCGTTAIDRVASGDERAVLEVADRLASVPPAHAVVRLHALSTVARWRQEADDHDGAAALLGEAAQLPLLGKARAVAARNFAHAELNRLQVVSQRDPEAAWREFQALRLPAGDAETAATARRIGARLAERRTLSLAREARCPETEAAVADWLALDPHAASAVIRAFCHSQRGQHYFKNSEWAHAAREMRQAMQIHPAEPAYRGNLLGALSNLAFEHIRARRCDLARAAIDEGLALAPSDESLRDAAQRCPR